MWPNVENFWGICPLWESLNFNFRLVFKYFFFYWANLFTKNHIELIDLTMTLNLTIFFENCMHSYSYAIWNQLKAVRIFFSKYTAEDIMYTRKLLFKFYKWIFLKFLKKKDRFLKNWETSKQLSKIFVCVYSKFLMYEIHLSFFTVYKIYLRNIMWGSFIIFYSKIQRICAMLKSL